MDKPKEPAARVRQFELSSGVLPAAGASAINSRSWWLAHWAAVLTGLTVVCLTSLPFLYAAAHAGPDHFFAGFLFNPQDGASYLAKMYQGWRGDWRFTLPYTAEQGRGAYLFLFYLALGHIARWLDLSLVFTFHLARLAGVLALLLALYRFLLSGYHNPRHSNLAFALAALGSGLGWLALLVGAFTADFWVAEAYPFLSSFATPHFAFGLTLLLWLLTPGQVNSPRDIPRWAFLRTAASLALAAISPFAVVIALLVTGLLAVWEKFSPLPTQASGRPPASRFAVCVVDCLSILVGGAPLLVYTQWAVLRDPVLAGWNAQNLTPSPLSWDVGLALSPVLLLALVGVPAAWRARQAGCRVWLAWAASGMLLLYLPFGLQRRFMLGLYVPLAGLSVYGLLALVQRFPRRLGRLAAVVFLFALPTNLLILLAAFQGIQTHAAQLYLSRGEVQALTWLSENTFPDALVVASPETGLFIPAFTGRRVIYGHPFETVNANAARAAVLAYYTGDEAGQPRPSNWGADFVWYGPREQALGDLPEQDGLHPVYSSKGVILYAVEH